jgi:hypothetical protein
LELPERSTRGERAAKAAANKLEEVPRPTVKGAKGNA